MELLPAVDLRAGGAVRLVQGDFARQVDYGDPLTVAQRFFDGGARWLHVVDLDAARTGEPTNRPTVLALARLAAAHGVRVESGGGIRTEGDVEALLGAGLDRVVLGTAALEDPAMAVRCARRRPGAVVIGLDYRVTADARREAAVRGWGEGSGTSVADALAAFGDEPFAAVVVTAIERDGTFAGPDTDGLIEVLDATALPVVASGGVGSVADLRGLGSLVGARSGRRVWGAIVGKALVDGLVGIEEAVAACAASG